MLVAHPFETFAKSIEKLTTNQLAVNSPQSRCLSKYLKELDAKSYVIETPYTDGGFLVDYAHYYSRCHTKYERSTHRIHFFKDTATELNHKFSEWVSSGNNPEEFNKKYCGFVVIKPLPKTIIGRTCLLTYPKEDDKAQRTRYFPILRTYKSTLHGIPLSVSTIAFQEQDKEISACATAAIWFALHGMPKKITTTEIVSPFEITNSSSNTYTKRAIGDVTRRFPTGGLSLEQIESYLRLYGVECIVCGILPNEVGQKLKDYLASYVRGGYPMIVVGSMYGSAQKDEDFELMGLHAVTALGYSESTTFEKDNKSQRIQRLYAHDDNIGPFTSFHFNTCETGNFTKLLKSKNKIESHDKIIDRIKGTLGDTPEDNITCYLENKSGIAKSGFAFRKFVPKYLIIPVNSKIRLPYEIVCTIAKQIGYAYEKRKSIIFGGKQAPTSGWDIELMDVSKVKQYIATSKTITRDNDFQELICIPMPKYVWRLGFTGFVEGTEIPWVDILLDATDLLQGGGVLAIITHDKYETAQTFTCALVMFIKEWIERYPHEIDADAEPIIQTLYQYISKPTH